MIPHSRPAIGQHAIEAVSAVLRSGSLAQGPVVAGFEKGVASQIGVSGAVAVSSGTAALHLALLALGVGPADQVVLPSYLCSAPLNAISYTGATPVLADVDPCTGNIDPASVARVLTPATKAIIVPHMFGFPAPIAEVGSLGVPVVEDCAMAIGAHSDNRPLGSFGDLAVCSFYATKVMTTGEGGMVLGRDRRLLDRVRELRDYDGRDSFEIRFNYKMTDFQAALGLSQLTDLGEFIASRRRTAAFYSAALKELPIGLPEEAPGSRACFYRYVLRLDGSANKFIEQMAAQGIICQRPVHRPLHQQLGVDGFAGARTMQEQAVSLPIYPSLTPEERERIAVTTKTTVEDLYG